MLFRRSFLLLSFSLLTLTAAHAQKGAPDVATAEARLAASQQKITELKAATDAARTTADGTREQVKTQDRALKDLKSQLIKQDAEVRKALTRQKAAEEAAKKDITAVKEAKKREKAGSKEKK